MKFAATVLGTAIAASQAAGVASCNGAQLTVPSDGTGDTSDSGTEPDSSLSVTAEGGAVATTPRDGGSTTAGDSGHPGGGGDGGGSVDSGKGGAPMEAGAPPPGTDAVSVIVEPSDDGKALFNAIKAAKVSIHMTMYLLTDNTFIGDLTAQAGKIDVKVLLNQTFPSSGVDTGSNSTSFAALQSGGVNAEWAPPGFTYTHEKSLIIDGTQLWVLTNNASVSGRDSNREYMVTDTDAADVAEAESLFEADFANTSIVPSGKLLASPDNMRAGLNTLIDSATSTLDFEVEEFYDTELASAFCAAAARHVTVRGVVAAVSDSSEDSTFATLKGCGVTLVELSTPYVHAKAIVADGTSAYVGSANFSSTSLDHNRELGLVLGDATAVAKVATTVAGDIAKGTPP